MSTRRFKTIFIICSLLCFSTVLFPVFHIGNRAFPLVFGLPFSFFWVVAWILITFFVIVTLYFTDPDKEEA